MATATLITSEEFLNRPDEYDASGNRIQEELINGEIVQVASKSKRHDIVKNNTWATILRYLDTRADLDLRVLIEMTFQVNEADTFIPDIAVLHRERLAEEGRVVTGAPEIAIEVVSPTDTAQGLRKKIKAYLENGAFSVWIFYDDASLAIHTRTAVRELTGDQVLEDPLLPGFSVPVSRFFAV